MKTRIAPTAVLWLLIGAAYFLLPLLAMLIFSLRSGTTGKCCTGANYSEIFRDPELWRSLKQSFLISLETIGLALEGVKPDSRRRSGFMRISAASILDERCTPSLLTVQRAWHV